MIKLAFCLRLKPELSGEEFQRYWHEQHAPLLKEHPETSLWLGEEKPIIAS